MSQKFTNSIESALKALDTFLKNSSRQGRENEIVNLFAHTFLSKYVDISQIGIEVAVQQLPDQWKQLVRKDLVVRWKPNQTVWNQKWNPVNNPIAIIERKVNDITKCEGDIEWLKSFVKIYPTVVCYSVCAFIKNDRGMKYKKIS